jgi:hypothetical protein
MEVPEMAADPAILPQSRRALLGAGLGGLVALIAHVLGRPLATRAANGDPVLVGNAHTGTQTTQLTNTNGGTAFFAQTTGTNEPGVGAIAAVNNDGIGIEAHSDSDAGVFATSVVGPAVIATSNDNVGVRGLATFASGIYGSSGEAPNQPASKTGVFGYGAFDASSRGVLGQSGPGTGVHGFASSGTGVHAQTLTGTALRVTGRATFSRSGRLTLAAGQSSITKSGIQLTSASLVLAVLQTNRVGIFVRAVAPSPSTSSFTIYLNAAVPGTTHVAWFVLN